MKQVAAVIMQGFSLKDTQYKAEQRHGLELLSGQTASAESRLQQPP